MTYGRDDSQLMNDDQVLEKCETGFYSSLVKASEEGVATLNSRFDRMERMITGQMQFLSPVVGAGSTADRQCTRFRHTMRQKVALAMQKAIQTFKARNGDG